VTESEFLERFDAHAARFDAHAARFDAHAARMDVALADIGEELRLNRKAREEDKAFMRDLTRRNELVYQGVMKQISELTAETIGSRAQLAELTAETRAQTQALLNVLDRLN
jgi:branched-subunit amino acid aminotransferase/4-amino-4-deoxychorismate lyase